MIDKFDDETTASDRRNLRAIIKPNTVLRDVYSALTLEQIGALVSVKVITKSSHGDGLKYNAIVNGHLLPNKIDTMALHFLTFSMKKKIVVPK